MSNREMIKKDFLSEISLDTFKEAIFLCYRDGITTVAPLGWSGNTIIIHEGNKEGNGRCSEVSIRNYCGDAELLITDYKGSFLFSGRFHASLGIDKIANKYYNIFIDVQDMILKVAPTRPQYPNVPIAETCTHSEGFKMLDAYQRIHQSPNTLNS